MYIFGLLLVLRESFHKARQTYSPTTKSALCSFLLKIPVQIFVVIVVICREELLKNIRRKKLKVPFKDQ